MGNDNLKRNKSNNPIKPSTSSYNLAHSNINGRKERERETDSGEGVAGIGDKETSLANSSVSNGDALDEP